MLNHPDGQDIRLVEQLLDNFITDLTDDNSNTFITKLEQLLIQIVKAGKDVHEWQKIISMLRRQTTSLLNPAERTKAENLWYQALVTINEIGERFLIHRQLIFFETNQLGFILLDRFERSKPLIKKLYSDSRKKINPPRKINR
jgi:hypothetical protein